MCDVVNFDYLEKHYPKLEKGAKVLEVGSYNVNGNTKEHTLKQGHEYLGLDINEGPDVDLICDIAGNIEDIKTKLNNQEFDLVTCMNVLEHLYEPIKALSNMKDLVKPGGYILMTTPIVWDLHDWPHDFYRLNPDFYIKFAKDNDLEILEDSFLFSVRNTRKFYKDMKNLPMPKKWLRKPLGLIFPELKQCWSHTYLSLVYRKK